MFVLTDGRSISPDVAFTDVNGIQRPANWLRLASPEEREEAGVSEIPDPPAYDQRYYWGYDQDGNLIPKQLEDEPAVDEDGNPILGENGVPIITTGLKTQLIRQQKEIAGTLLAPTDWYITRKTENGSEVPDWALNFRQAIREASNQRETQLGVPVTVDELIALLNAQPTVIDFETQESIPNPDPFLTPWPAL
jgi:hypothetical protein